MRDKEIPFVTVGFIAFCVVAAPVMVGLFLTDRETQRIAAAKELPEAVPTPQPAGRLRDYPLTAVPPVHKQIEPPAVVETEKTIRQAQVGESSRDSDRVVRVELLKRRHQEHAELDLRVTNDSPFKLSFVSFHVKLRGADGEYVGVDQAACADLDPRQSKMVTVFNSEEFASRARVFEISIDQVSAVGDDQRGTYSLSVRGQL